MKKLLPVVVLAALLIAYQSARAVEDPPDPHYQIIEAETMLPVLESYPAVTAGTATQSIVRRQASTGAAVFSSAAAALFDNHNADGSRATFPLEVEDADTYGISLAFARGPAYGIVQVAIDGRPFGPSFDGYAAAAARPDPVMQGVLGLAEGKHTLTLTVTDRNPASSDYMAALDFVTLDSEAAPQPTPTAVATAEAGGTVPATLALTLGAPANFGPFQPGVARDYTATATANVISTAGDAALTVSDPSTTATGHLVNGTRALPQALKVAGKDLPAVAKTWTEPISNDAVPIEFKQSIAAADALRTGTYAKTLTFTLSTTNP